MEGLFSPDFTVYQLRYNIRKYGSTFYNRDSYGHFALFWPYEKTEISVFTFTFHSI